MVLRLALIIVIVGAVGLARAEQKPAAPKDAATIEAGRRYDVGMRLYNVSEWGAALEEFKQAYLLKADPAFLFNIGQCQRQLKRYDDAAKSYRAYLREAQGVSDRERDQVKTLVQQMEQAVHDARAAQPPTGIAAPEGALPKPKEETVVTPPSPPVAVVVAAAPAKKPLYKKWWLWTVVGVGAAALAAGLGAGLTAGTSYPSPAMPTDAKVRF